MEGSIAFVDTAVDGNVGGGDFEADPATTQSLYQDMAIFLQNKLTEKYMEACGKEFPYVVNRINTGLEKIRDHNPDITEKLTGLYNGIVRSGGDEAWYNKDVEHFLLVRVLLFLGYNPDQIGKILDNITELDAMELEFNGNFGITPEEQDSIEYLRSDAYVDPDDE